ncbi:MAG: nucleoid-associated protein [Bacteroidota bacterium]|nr:nucleoid-associated protein [Bacteroidota bacterium]
MLSLSNSTIYKIALHLVGNKSTEIQNTYSKSELALNDDTKELLTKYFLNPFRNSPFFNLSHTTDLSLNEIYVYASKIFADPDCLFLQSVNISKHLFETTNHPNIKPGELYVVFFEGCIVDEEEVNCIGIFKSENKDTFLKVASEGDNFDIFTEMGINVNKLDKGCLIFETEKDKGYKVCIVDQTNKGEEARFWKTDFLQAIPRNDSYHYTQNYLDLCKSYVTSKLPEEFEVSKTDQIDLLNRSVQFFKKNDQFNVNEFQEAVIQQEELISSFKNYKKDYATNFDLPIVDEFEISEQAVKKQSRIFKSVLKLDKNFHIYIHGNKELIEKGTDEVTGMKYYKIYFKEEF